MFEHLCLLYELAFLAVLETDVGIVAGSNSPVMTLSVFVFFLFWSMAAKSCQYFYHSI